MVARDIWLIVVGEPLHFEAGSRAFRTRLLAMELARRGHRVTWWTSDFNHFSKEYHPRSTADTMTPEGYHLRFLRGRPYRRNISIARQVNHLQIARDFRRQAVDAPRPDLIVCCLPSIELAAAAVAYSNARDLPVVVDIRDLWPDEMLARLPAALRPIGRAALLPLERSVAKTLRGATGIIAVSEGYLNWGLAKAGRPPGAWDRMIPLGYPDHGDAAAARHARTTSADRCGLFFSGSFNNSVDLDTLIAAVRHLPDPRLTLTICGRGDYETRWRATAAGDPRIRFTGWVDAAELRKQAGAADIGMICYRPESLVAMPNKLFEYISLGLPVINCISGEAAALVRDEQIGLYYEPGSPRSLAAAIGELLQAPDRRLEMSRRATALFEARYAASTISRSYSALLEAVMEMP